MKKFERKRKFETLKSTDHFACDTWTGRRKFTAVGCFERHNRSRSTWYTKDKLDGFANYLMDEIDKLRGDYV